MEKKIKTKTKITSGEDWFRLFYRFKKKKKDSKKKF